MQDRGREYRGTGLQGSRVRGLEGHKVPGFQGLQGPKPPSFTVQGYRVTKFQGVQGYRVGHGSRHVPVKLATGPGMSRINWPRVQACPGYLVTRCLGPGMSRLNAPGTG